MKALQTAVQKKQYDPAYYLHGEEEFRKEDAIRYLIDHAVDHATRDFNLDQRKGAELDGETLASLLAMPPMMAERRVIVIRDVTGLRKDARGALDAYLNAPAADLLLLLTAPADAKTDKTLAQLATAIEFDAMPGSQVPKWITARVEKLGARITPDATALLQNAVGTDLSQLATEIEKLVAYSGTAEIDEEAVATVVGVRREETLGNLLDAIAMRDVPRALTSLGGVLQQPKTTAVYIVMTLTTQMLALALGKARGARSSFDYVNILKSGTSNVVGRTWGEATAVWARAASKWSLAELDRALEVLLDTDIALKQSRVSSEEQVMATAILSMCGGAAHRTAA
jgi:DNA polymerase III subunit delta